MQEAWEWDVETYKLEFDDRNRISPDDYRKGDACIKRNNNRFSSL